MSPNRCLNRGVSIRRYEDQAFRYARRWGQSYCVGTAGMTRRTMILVALGIATVPGAGDGAGAIAVESERMRWRRDGVERKKDYRQHRQCRRNIPRDDAPHAHYVYLRSELPSHDGACAQPKSDGVRFGHSATPSIIRPSAFQPHRFAQSYQLRLCAGEQMAVLQGRDLWTMNSFGRVATISASSSPALTISRASQKPA